MTCRCLTGAQLRPPSSQMSFRFLDQDAGCSVLSCSPLAYNGLMNRSTAVRWQAGHRPLRHRYLYSKGLQRIEQLQHRIPLILIMQPASDCSPMLQQESGCRRREGADETGMTGPPAVHFLVPHSPAESDAACDACKDDQPAKGQQLTTTVLHALRYPAKSGIRQRLLLRQSTTRLQLFTRACVANESKRGGEREKRKRSDTLCYRRKSRRKRENSILPDSSFTTSWAGEKKK